MHVCINLYINCTSFHLWRYSNKRVSQTVTSENLNIINKILGSLAIKKLNKNRVGNSTLLIYLRFYDNKRENSIKFIL